MWHYRDYVIKSINDDKPWDRFLTEQLAGDEMVDWRNAKKYTPEISRAADGDRATCATSSISPTRTSPNLPVERYEALFKLMEKVSSSTLGLTVACARCHTHKFDPIPQRDYYRFLSLFTPAYNPTRLAAAEEPLSVHRLQGRAGRDREAQRRNRPSRRRAEEAVRRRFASLTNSVFSTRS